MSTADDLIAHARERTELHDLGPESFHEGLVQLVDGMEQAGTINELGTAVIHDQAIGYLVIRLEIEDWYRRHPEIDEQMIAPPLFGLGLPRTGSTALSYLQATDPATRSLRTWETNKPTPPPDPATEDTDPRIAEAAVAIRHPGRRPRLRAASGWAQRRAGAGHHHRCRLPLLHHRTPQVHRG